jgi:hypothetical protein
MVSQNDLHDRSRIFAEHRNIFWWLDTFLNASFARDLDTVPNRSGANPLHLDPDASGG